MKYLKTYILFIFLFHFGNIFYAQKDSTSTHGTIKIAKSKTELYIKAFADFQMYNPALSNNGNSYKAFVQAATPIPNAFAPEPITFNYKQAFSYTSYFMNNPGLRTVSIGDKNIDTVIIEIDVMSNGEYYYYHTNPQKKYITATKNGNDVKYTFSDAQIGTMIVLNGITQWDPGYVITYKKGKKKKKNTAQRVNLNAKGVLTVIFSTTPID